MSIETVCAGCQLTLRVGEEHQGKQARCPVCGHIYTIPVLASAVAAGEASPAPIAAAPVGHSSTPSNERGPGPQMWLMKTPEGQTYGPVDRAELDRWMAEGRIAADCDLREGDRGWISADQLYPSLRPRAVGASAGAPGRAPLNARQDSRGSYSTGATPTGAWSRPQGYASGASASMAPHRGGLVLGLGISGLVLGLFLVCPVLSIMAWVMGNGDLREMGAGRMDPSGSAMTQIGQIMGMIISLLWIVTCVILLFVFLLAAALNM